MFLLWILTLTAGPDVGRLGADDWHTRERETARVDNVLLALLLPKTSEDPEVDYRIRLLRTRNLKWLDAVYVERQILRADFAVWLDSYLFAGRSGIAGEWDTFALIHTDAGKAMVVFRGWPPMPGQPRSFLFGVICPGEYERYRAYLDYHLMRAPPPRGVGDPEP